MGGPQDMTYFIQPKHMNVRYPRNVNDEDLLTQPADFERQMSEATSMSYFLHRLRFSEICRDIVDRMSTSMSTIEGVNYDDVIYLDNQLDAFLKELPKFFVADDISIGASQETDRSLPQVPNQRYSINVFAQCRRIRLHQPFMIRGSHDTRYAYSREACLRSARAVVYATSLLGVGKSPFGLAHESSYFVIRHLFLATVALVMDLCFNRVEGQNEQRRREVMEICKKLEEYKENSPVAGSYLESLKNVLRKHNIHLKSPSVDPLSTEQLPNNEDVLSEDPIEGADQISQAAKEQSMDFDFDFDGDWQNCFDIRQNLDVTYWDQLFSELDSHST
jgi:hypothetical protein